MNPIIYRQGGCWRWREPIAPGPYEATLRLLPHELQVELAGRIHLAADWCYRRNQRDRESS